MTMPPELMELYMLYQQELDTRTDNENKIINDANVMIRVTNIQSKLIKDVGHEQNLTRALTSE